MKEYLNTKQGKIVTVAVILVLAGLIWWFFVREKPVKKEKEDAAKKADEVSEETADTSEQEEPATFMGIKADPLPFPLKKGMKGKEVEQLQRYMASHYKAEFPEGFTGVFDDHLEQIVKTNTHHDTVGKSFFTKRKILGFKTEKYA